MKRVFTALLGGGALALTAGLTTAAAAAPADASTHLCDNAATTYCVISQGQGQQVLTTGPGGGTFANFTKTNVGSWDGTTLYTLTDGNGHCLREQTNHTVEIGNGACSPTDHKSWWSYSHPAGNGNWYQDYGMQGDYMSALYQANPVIGHDTNGVFLIGDH